MSYLRVTGDYWRFLFAVDAALLEAGQPSANWNVTSDGNVGKVGMWPTAPADCELRPWWDAFVRAVRLAERTVDEVRVDTSPLSKDQTIDEWAQLLFPARTAS